MKENKFYIKRQNHFTQILKYTISEMNSNVFQLSMECDQLYNENIKLINKVNKLEIENKFIKQENEDFRRKLNELDKGE